MDLETCCWSCALWFVSTYSRRNILPDILSHILITLVDVGLILSCWRRHFLCLHKKKLNFKGYHIHFIFSAKKIELTFAITEITNCPGILGTRYTRSGTTHLYCCCILCAFHTCFTKLCCSKIKTSWAGYCKKRGGQNKHIKILSSF